MNLGHLCLPVPTAGLHAADQDSLERIGVRGQTLFAAGPQRGAGGARRSGWIGTRAGHGAVARVAGRESVSNAELVDGRRVVELSRSKNGRREVGVVR